VYKIGPCAISLFVILTLCPPVFADGPGIDAEGAGEKWVVVESAYTTAYVRGGLDLDAVSAKIDVGFARYDPLERRLFLNKGLPDKERLAMKLDAITRKAKNILDMDPEDFHVKIKICESDRELEEAYKSICGEHRSYKGFYVHKLRTVYVSFESMSESVIAHEIGHSIIDSYFTILPPEKIRELLACYVDVHLKD